MGNVAGERQRNGKRRPAAPLDVGRAPVAILSWAWMKEVEWLEKMVWGHVGVQNAIDFSVTSSNSAVEIVPGPSFEMDEAEKGRKSQCRLSV